MERWDQHKDGYDALAENLTMAMFTVRHAIHQAKPREKKWATRLKAMETELFDMHLDCFTDEYRSKLRGPSDS